MILFPSVILAIENDDDRDLMKSVYLRYKNLMFSIAYEFATDDYSAEDIVSDVCAALVDKVDTLRGLAEKQRYYYIANTARNKAIDYARMRKRQNEHVVYYNDEVGIRDAASDQNVDDRIIREVEISILMEALALIDAKHYDILRMKYFELLTDSEIADRIGVKPSSVRYYLTLARRALREVLHDNE